MSADSAFRRGLKLFLALHLLQLLTLCSCHLPLEVSQGRYNNLVIGIDRSVAENATLLEEIKTVLQEASLSLVLATRRSGQPGGLALGDVTILVPDTWPQRPQYEAATWQLYSKSQIRVGPRNPRYGPVPHTESAGGCGSPGEYTHYPTDFFLDRAAAEQLFGSRSRLMVHEWGHLRWGLMDEAPQENDPQFYIYNNKFYPTRCSEQLDGKMANKVTGLPCKLDKQTMTPEPDCIFIPNENNRALVSYMGHYHVSSIKAFCDQSSHPDEAYRHNRMAPTQHNRLCRSRSVWQVIENHQDFQQARPIELDPNPSIRVVRARSRDTVAVLDVSESMLHPNNVPFLKLKSAMINYIRTVLEPDARLGIVTFSSGVKLVSGLTVLGPTGSDARRNLESQVNQLDAIGQTDLGDGLMLGLQQLLLNNTNSSGGFLFLVSDGEENRSSRSRYDFKTSAAAIKAAGVTVDVLGLGPDADKRIGDLARETGGNFYSSFNTRNSFDLLSAMLSSAGRSRAGPDTPVLLHAADIASQAFAAAPVTVAIDSSARGSLLFVFLFPVSADLSRVDFNLTTPSGRVYTSRSSGAQRDPAIYMMSMAINETEFQPGLWAVRVSAPAKPGTPDTADQTVSMVVSSKPAVGGGGGGSPGAQPITASSSLSTFKLANNSALNGADLNGVTVSATLRSGANSVVLGARVSASVRTPDNGQLSVSLLDNGVGMDLRPNDGVYTGVLSPRWLTGAGDYMVSVSAESVDGVTGVLVEAPVALAAGDSSLAGLRNTRANYTQIPVSNLTRSSQTGSFKLENFIEAEHRVDRVPPSPIGSLDLLAVNATDGRMSLAWIAVGDDYDQGTAARYDVFWSTSSENLTNPDDPNSGATPIRPENVDFGNLTSPSPSGRRETLGLRFPGAAAAGTVVFVTIRAVDAAGNRGGFAFPKSATFAELPFVETSPPTQPPGGGGLSLGVVIGIVVSVVVVAVVIAAGLFYKLRWHGGGGSRRS